MKGVALLAGLLASTASAHIQMSQPYPIRSPLNTDSDEQKDYSYTNPLQPSGQDYPCKGYADDKFVSRATYEPGQQYEMDLEGSATHEGGSCQIALTYDRGKTFKVIESMLGDCPIAKQYNFTVPSDAPSGEALLAWTWFNKVGNREMYMNCAMVTVGGSSDGEETPAELPDKNKPGNKHAKNQMDNKQTTEMQNKEHAHEVHPDMNHDENQHQNQQRDMTDSAGQKKTMAFDSLPPLFVANVNQIGQCVTIEGETVNFPMPGDNVVGTSDGKGYKCSGDAPFLGASNSSQSTASSSDSNNNDSQSTASSSGSNNNDSQSTASSSDNNNNDNKNATRSNNNDENMSKIASAFGTPSAVPRVVSTEASTNNEFKNYVSGWSCTDGEIICAPDGWTWALCSNSRPVFMGSVAAGMTCRFGQMVPAQW